MLTARHYRPVFTDSTFAMLDAELDHRRHAVVEPAIADGKAGPLSHMSSRDCQANGLAHVVGDVSQSPAGRRSLASHFQVKAAPATLRAYLVHVPARLAHAARTQLTAHLPERWPWRDAWLSLLDAIHLPQTAAS